MLPSIYLIPLKWEQQNHSKRSLSVNQNATIYNNCTCESILSQAVVDDPRKPHLNILELSKEQKNYSIEDQQRLITMIQNIQRLSKD